MNPDVTVVIASYNPGLYLNKALKSVFNQSYNKWKIILIDDSSTDDSLIENKELIQNPRVTLIRNNENIGKSKSLNKVLSLVDTPYLVELDSDDWFYKKTLKVLVSEAEKATDNIALFGGNLQMVFENKKGSFYYKKKLQGRLPVDGYDYLVYHKDMWPRFYRTSALKSVGGWPIDDPYEGRYLDDFRIILRLIEKYQFKYINETLYGYRRHSNNITNNSTIISDAFKWIIQDTLKRWGNEYRPIFTNDKNLISTFVKLIKNK